MRHDPEIKLSTPQSENEYSKNSLFTFDYAVYVKNLSLRKNNKTAFISYFLLPNRFTVFTTVV